MQLIALTNEGLKEELLNQGVQPGAELVCVSEVRDFLNYPGADAFIDLLFENTEERLQLLRQLSPAPVIINSVAHTLQETHPSFIRINGWNTFLKADWIEAAALPGQRPQAEAILAQFNKKVEWLPDEAGFITPRVISMIINEAFMALQEEVSSKKEIDTALKLGTNYPYGPFEWAEKIGERSVALLLKKLSLHQSRYAPCPLLQAFIA